MGDRPTGSARTGCIRRGMASRTERTIVKPKETWEYIHAERAEMAETLAGLTPEQWESPSWCEGWTVQQTAGHILAAAEQTPPHFYKELIAARFRFNVFTDEGAKRLGALPSDEFVRRLRVRTTTTNHPPAPVIAMLGEIIVHGEDIRRPVGLEHQSPTPALIAVADSWKGSNLLIGAKRRIAGLRLRATDTESGARRRSRRLPGRCSHCSGHDRAQGRLHRPHRRWPRASSAPGPEDPGRHGGQLRGTSRQGASRHCRAPGEVRARARPPRSC